ncbi:hypothetical protein [Shouchella miscanthi]|uniref:hypothetical protein n=1 Tax=Shouchella miscanthi TaxID=2598861 RepID=UPI0011A20A5A|nr:hypothetical protein [Shouchella miscanthi]
MATEERMIYIKNDPLYLTIGNTKIKIIPPTDPEVIKRAHEDFHRVSWEVWRSFTPEEQIKINAKYGEKKT